VVAELDRVRDQVGEDLLEAQPIAREHRRDGTVSQLEHVGALVGAGGVDQPLDESVQAFAALATLLEKAALRLRERPHLLAQEQAAVATDHRDRSAQLVTHHGEQLLALAALAAQALAQSLALAIRLGQLAAHPVQLALEPAQMGHVLDDPEDGGVAGRRAEAMAEHLSALGAGAEQPAVDLARAFAPRQASTAVLEQIVELDTRQSLGVVRGVSASGQPAQEAVRPDDAAIAGQQHPLRQRIGQLPGRIAVVYIPGRGVQGCLGHPWTHRPERA
jgi:hypothetical protein